MWLVNEGRVAFEVILVPVDCRRKQVIGFRIEIDISWVRDAESHSANIAESFACNLSNGTIHFVLSHRSLQGKGKRPPNAGQSQEKQLPHTREANVQIVGLATA